MQLWIYTSQMGRVCSASQIPPNGIGRHGRIVTLFPKFVNDSPNNHYEEDRKYWTDDLPLIHGVTEQVIIQVWISTYFGVLSERLPATDESIGFIMGMFTPV